MLRTSLAFLAAVVVLMAVVSLLGGSHSGLIAVGARAPELTAAQWVGGEAPEFAGKIVVVDVFATWCGPCVQAMPALIEVHREFDPHGVLFIGLTNEPGDARSEVEAFRERLGIPWTLGIDAGATIQKLGVRTIPVLIVIGPDGQVISAGDDEKQLRSTLSRAVAYQRQL